MGEFVKVGKTGDVPPGTARTFDVNGIPVALFNTGGTIYATHNTCLHRGGPLGEGTLEGTTVTCPWHLWQYDVATGKCLVNPELHVQTFQVRTEGEDIFVEV